MTFKQLEQGEKFILTSSAFNDGESTLHVKIGVEARDPKSKTSAISVAYGTPAAVHDDAEIIKVIL